jgi:predicted PurR-regulated permease PerM
MIYGRTVEIHPLTVFVAILIGAALLGMLGALIAIPVAAGIQSVALDVYRYSDFGKAQAMARHEKVKRRAQIGPDPPEQEPA